MGTAFLVAAIIGSGIAAQRLNPHDVGLELLESSSATGAALVAIILMVGPVSGAHLNPVISLVDRALGGLTNLQSMVYVVAQLLGGVLGAAAANLMFSLPAFALSTNTRAGPGLLLAESIATVGLLLVVFGVARSRQAAAAPFAWGPTSRPRTGSPPPPASRIPPSRWRGH